MNNTPTWTHQQIRDARKTPLKPLLQRLGYQLEPRREGNYRITGQLADIVIKEHYWVRLGTTGHTPPEDGRNAGNAIDLLIHLRGISFHRAMQIITEQPRAPAPPPNGS